MAMMDASRMMKAAGAATTYAPYMRRLMRDERLRAELADLVRAANRLYQELAKDDGLDKLLKDDRIRKDIDSVLESAQKAGRRAMKQRRSTNWWAIAGISAAVGAVVAVLVYPRTRHGLQEAAVSARGRTMHAVEDLQQKAA